MGCIFNKIVNRNHKVSYKLSKRLSKVPSLDDSQRDRIKVGWQNLSQDMGNIGVLTFVRYVETT